MASQSDLEPYPIPVTLKILQEDIDFGVRQDSYGCMVAHAIMRQKPDAIRVRVNKKKIAWSDALLDERYIFDTPDSVSKKLEAFDLGGTVKPFQVTLRGGQFRAVEHDADHARENREYQREAKLRAVAAGEPTPGERVYQFRQANAARTYERYVEAADNL